MHRLTEFSLRRPWLTLGVLLSLTVGLAFGLPNLETKYGYRVLIGDDHPSIVSLDNLIPLSVRVADRDVRYHYTPAAKRP